MSDEPKKSLTDQFLQQAKDSPMPSDSRRVRGTVTKEGGAVSYEKTWKNGFGLMTWFSKTKTQGNAAGFEITKTGDDK